MKNRGAWRNAQLAVLLGILLVLTAPAVRAQSQNISGTVVDASGGVVPDATVRITDAAKEGAARETTTDNSGRFQAINIQPGKLLITVEKTGFKKTEFTITLDVNAKLDLGQIRLQVGNITDAVSVSAEITPLVTTNTMEKAFVVEKTQISELPMNGRNFTSLMATVPGMTSANRNDFDVNFNDVSQFHSLGGRGSQNNFYLDGSPNIDVGDSQSQYTQASVDGVAEFRVLQSSFNAEYGRNAGMVIAVQTKSGAARFHGTAYEYFRNNWLDAKCVQSCATLQPQLRYNQFGGNFSGWVPLPKVSTVQNKKLFFFYNREMTRRNLPGTAYSDIPNATILSGDFRPWLLDTNMQYAPQFKNGTVFQPGTITRDGSGNITGGTPYANNIVPQSQWQALSSSLLKVYTGIPGFASLPAAPNPGYVRYYYNNPDNLVKNQDILRVDYVITSKVNTFFRWVNDYQKESFQTAIWGGEPFPIQPQWRPKPGSSWSWNLVTTFTPTVASETILAYNHQTQSLSILGDNPLNRDKIGANWAQLYPATNITNSVMDVTTNNGFGWGLGNPGWHNTGKDYAATENLSWVKGTHTFKFGLYYNRDFKTQTGTWPQQGAINFSSASSMPNDTGNGLANLMLGNFNNFNQPSGAVYPYFRFWELDFYAQDSWKISKRLTLEYGVRLSYIVPTYTVVRSGTPGGEGTWTLYGVDLKKYDASKKPSINLTNGNLIGSPMTVLQPLGLVCDPCSGIPSGFSPAKTMPLPRIGFAYDVFGDGKMSLRGGFGMFTERLRQNNFNFGAGAQWPNLVSGNVYNGNVNAIDLSGVGNPNAPIQPPNMAIWPSDNKVPSIYSWYFGIQRELPGKFTLDASYSGNHSIHLMDQRSVNALPAGWLQNNNLSQSVNFYTAALLPWTGWGNLNAIETLGYARYNAAMFRLARRFAHGFSVNFNYTRSSVKDTNDNDSDQIVNPFNLRQSYAAAGYDQPNTFSIDSVYELPKLTTTNPVARQALNGWELSGIFRAQSGLPVTITSNGNLYGVNLGGNYANQVGDPYANNNAFQWLNPAAFVRPADGTWGSAGRNSVRLPSIWNTDLALMKNFSIQEKAKVTFRCEVFNFFNHPQPWGMNTGFSGDNPGSGLSNSAKNFGQINAYRDARTIQLALRFAF